MKLKDLDFDIHDWQDSVKDVTYVYFTHIWLMVGEWLSGFIPISENMFCAISALIHSFIVMLLCRLLPALLCIIVAWGLCLYSLANGQGIFLASLLFIDFVRLLFNRSPPKLLETPKHRYSDAGKNPWYTTGFNVNVAILIVVVAVGIKYGILDGGVVAILVGVLSTSILSQSFPTVGGHSTGNNFILFMVLILAVMFSMGGMADLMDSLRKFFSAETVRVVESPPPVSSSLFNDMYLSFGPIFTWMRGDTQWGYSIYNFTSLCRFIMGNAFLMWIILSNVRGPGVLVDMLSKILNKPRQGEEQRN